MMTAAAFRLVSRLNVSMMIVAGGTFADASRANEGVALVERDMGEIEELTDADRRMINAAIDRVDAKISAVWAAV